MDALDPLTVRLALQHLSEERLGSAIRRERAIEEAKARQSAAALGRSKE